MRERRRDIRIRTEITGTFNGKDVRVFDLSASGAGVTTEGFFTPGEAGPLTFHLQDQVVSLNCVVAWVHGKACGLKFEITGRDEKEKLSQYIAGVLYVGNDENEIHSADDLEL